MDGVRVASGGFERLPCISVLHLVLHTPSLERIWQMAIQSLFWVASFSPLHKESLPTTPYVAITMFLHWAQICFPLVSVLALYRIAHSNSFIFSYCVFCFAIFSLPGSSVHLSQLTFKPWPPCETKINTDLLRLYPLSHRPWHLLINISDGGLHGLCVPESSSWCRSWTPGNLLQEPRRVSSAELDGFSVHFLELEQAVVWGEAVSSTPVLCPGGPCDDLMSAYREAFWDGRKPEIFVMKKRKLPFLCRMSWMVNCEPEADVTWDISVLPASQPGLEIYASMAFCAL